MESKYTLTKKKKEVNGTKEVFGVKKTARKTADRVLTLLLFGIMTIGILLIGYPSFSDYWNSFHQTKTVMTYAQSIADMNTEEYKKILESAHEYNAGLAERGINWSFTGEERAAYYNELRIDKDGVMGYITIQKINVMLPIYHGTDDKVLLTSIGHLEQSSLPVGGKGSHCLLSGHRGLPSARLFTDIDQLKETDTFTITVLNETLTYEVDHIWIVEPNDVTHLNIEDGQDYCTLITCTPYGINSHRLLVRGHRINNLNGDAKVVADAIQIKPVYIAPFLAVPMLFFLLIYVLITTSVRIRNKKNYVSRYLDSYGLKEAEIEQEEKDLILEKFQKFVQSRKKE